jgi:hypothetical protein
MAAREVSQRGNERNLLDVPREKGYVCDAILKAAVADGAADCSDEPAEPGVRSHRWPTDPCLCKRINFLILVGSSPSRARRGTAPGPRPSATRQADGPSAASGGAADEPINRLPPMPELDQNGTGHRRCVGASPQACEQNSTRLRSKHPPIAQSGNRLGRRAGSETSGALGSPPDRVSGASRHPLAGSTSTKRRTDEVSPASPARGAPT